TGSTSFSAIATATNQKDLLSDPLMLAGIALTSVGLAFKVSAAPFHQWTPDVYEGAPTPITTFMATATKVAALAILIRLFTGPLAALTDDWAPILAAISTLSIVVGNAGALGQDSLKRMLAWSSIAQAGYLLAGLVVATSLGVEALVYYLGVYVVITIASFAVVLAVQTENEGNDRLEVFAGLGKRRPVLAGAMTLSMLSLAGLPPTGGFIGKVSLINADVSGGYTWLAIVIVLGSLVSLGYYLRVISTIWMSSPAAETAKPSGRRVPELAVIAVVAAVIGLAAGIAPNWPLDRAAEMGNQIAKR
ncbi:MAG: NADH-quinone oxidoreductase subunit N, partial [Actinomycetes bacterium]